MSRIYKTTSGDIWDTIAREQLGSEIYTHTLMQANQQYLQTVIFKAGVELTIPDIGTPIPNPLPPWKATS